MEQSSSEKQLRIRKQFDSFCKTLLKNEMIDYERARSYRQKHEVSFSELTQEELRCVVHWRSGRRLSLLLR